MPAAWPGCHISACCTSAGRCPALVSKKERANRPRAGFNMCEIFHADQPRKRLADGEKQSVRRAPSPKSLKRKELCPGTDGGATRVKASSRSNRRLSSSSSANAAGGSGLRKFCRSFGDYVAPLREKSWLRRHDLIITCDHWKHAATCRKFCFHTAVEDYFVLQRNLLFWCQMCRCPSKSIASTEGLSM